MTTMTICDVKMKWNEMKWDDGVLLLLLLLLYFEKEISTWNSSLLSKIEKETAETKRDRKRERERNPSFKSSSSSSSS